MLEKFPATFPEFVKIWNELQGQAMPQVHQHICHWLEERWNGGDRQLLLMAFRNCGKSTLVGLFAAWVLYQNPSLRILVLAADYALAKKMVRNVKRILEKHTLTESLIPTRADQWAADQFTVAREKELRDPSMLARGLTGNITGSRAGIIICDDVEVPNTCATHLLREDLRTKLSEIEYILVPGGLVLYVGTPHTFYSIYGGHTNLEEDESQPFLEDFNRLLIPLLDEAGQSVWPERFSAADIARIKKRTGPNKFESQMMLRPVNIVEGRLDSDLLKFYEDEVEYREAHRSAVLTINGRRMVAASCWWDPAYGAAAPGKGDASVIAAIYIDAEGEYWLHHIHYIKVKENDSVDAATQQCRQVAQFLKELHLPAVAVETNGLGKLLPGLLRQELHKMGMPISVTEVTNRTPKATRILESFDAPLAAGRLHAHTRVRQTPFMREIREWIPTGRGYDDGLDAVAGALSMTPVRFARVKTVLPERQVDWRGV